MRRVARGWLIACSAMLLSGCLVNSVERFDDGPPSRLSKGRAYVLIGMSVADGVTPTDPYGVSYQEYSREKGAISGDCFNWDRIETTFVTGPTPVRFEVFAAPAGAYSLRYGGGESAPTGFVARAGVLNYLGTFTLRGYRDIPAQRYDPPRRVQDLGYDADIAAARGYAAANSLPEPRPAETFDAPGGAAMFLCAP